VIIDTTTCFKRKRVSTHIDPGVPIPIIEALMVVFLLPQLPTLLAEAAATRLGFLLELFLRELSMRILCQPYF